MRGPEAPEWVCRDHSIASEWDLICGSTWMLQLANSGFFLGSLGGLFLFQQIAEELGEQQASCFCLLSRGKNEIFITAKTLQQLK